MRKIVIKGQTWQYTIGESAVRFVAPDGKAFHTDLTIVTGKSNDEIERGKHKKYFSVTPIDVAKYLESIF